MIPVLDHLSLSKGTVDVRGAKPGCTELAAPADPRPLFLGVDNGNIFSISSPLGVEMAVTLEHLDVSSDGNYGPTLSVTGFGGANETVVIKDSVVAAITVADGASASLVNALVARNTSSTSTKSISVSAESSFTGIASTFADLRVSYAPSATGTFTQNIAWSTMGGGFEVFSAAPNQIVGTCNMGTGVWRLTCAGAPACDNEPGVNPLCGEDPGGRTDFWPASTRVDVCPSGPALDLFNTARPLGAGFDRGVFEAM